MNYKQNRIGTILYDRNSYEESIFSTDIDKTDSYISLEEFKKLKNKSIPIKSNRTIISILFMYIFRMN
jgi:hypothetical protein